METIYTQALIETGLTKNQAIIYELLLKSGGLRASGVVRNLGGTLSRPMVYLVLDELCALGLVEKNEVDTKVARFIPYHPSKLGEVVDEKRKKTEVMHDAASTLIPKMVSTFNLVLHRPGVRFFEGVEGLKRVYADILSKGETIYLVRSKYEPVYQNQIVPIINDFIMRRVKKGMHVIALTPEEADRVIDTSKDAGLLFDRTWIKGDAYNAHVEIDIYGNSVALLSFGTELIGVVIESEQMARALKQLFLLAKLGAGTT